MCMIYLIRWRRRAHEKAIGFCGWSDNLERASPRPEATNKHALFSVPPALEDCSFPHGLGRERP